MPSFPHTLRFPSRLLGAASDGWRRSISCGRFRAPSPRLWRGPLAWLPPSTSSPHLLRLAALLGRCFPERPCARLACCDRPRVLSHLPGAGAACRGSPLGFGCACSTACSPSLTLSRLSLPHCRTKRCPAALGLGRGGRGVAPAAQAFGVSCPGPVWAFAEAPPAAARSLEGRARLFFSLFLQSIRRQTCL